MDQNNLLNLFLGFFVSGLVYTYWNDIKIIYMLYKGKQAANEITIEFFRNLLKRNESITLDEAILKFEDVYNKFDNLEEFAKSKLRNTQKYRDAYSHLFIEAQRSII
tara:strand:+ start:235 stop:555 length:321 start_codon:yes stop_codon:yes gene_type:complete